MSNIKSLICFNHICNEYQHIHFFKTVQENGDNTSSAVKKKKKLFFFPAMKLYVESSMLITVNIQQMLFKLIHVL